MSNAINSPWIEYDSPETLAAALPLARGCYQRALLRGDEALSGSTLRGKAKQWSSRYAASRDSLLARLRAAGLSVSEARRAHWRRVLIVSAANVEVVS